MGNFIKAGQMLDKRIRLLVLLGNSSYFQMWKLFYWQFGGLVDKKWFALKLDFFGIFDNVLRLKNGSYSFENKNNY